MAGVSSLQVIKPAEINPLTANTWNFKDINTPLPYLRMVSYIIDGKQSDKFSDPSNLLGLELDRDQSTSNAFYRYDESNGVHNYFRKVRQTYGQDMQDGVIIPIDALATNIPDASDQTGDGYLNLTSTGFPSSRIGVKVGETSTALGITPRVVSYGLVLSDPIRMA
jgi:hypothetical protein